MFSLDLLLIGYLKIIVAFIIANKFSIFSAFYVLQQGARMTKTTVDDSILTFLKNIFLRVIGKGFKVEEEYHKLKDAGLVKVGLDKKTIKYLKEQMAGDEKSQLPDVNTDIPMPSVKPPRLDED